MKGFVQALVTVVGANDKEDEINGAGKQLNAETNIGLPSIAHQPKVRASDVTFSTRQRNKSKLNSKVNCVRPEQMIPMEESRSSDF